MAIYIFSDDNYFSTGLSNLINKENTTIHSYSWEQWEPHFIHRQIGYGDILLLDGSNQKFIKKSLCFQLNQHCVKVFIFYDNRKKLLPAFAHWPHGAKNMGVKNLNDTLARFYRQPVQHGLPSRAVNAKRKSGHRPYLPLPPQLPHRPGAVDFGKILVIIKKMH